MSTNLQDWVELLNAEQHVQVDKLREHARHGVASRVRGEVWLYLLEVLSEDKTAEISSLLSLNTTYQVLPSELPSSLTSTLLRTALSHHTKRFRNETYAGLITSLTSEQTSSSYGKGKDKSQNRQQQQNTNSSNSSNNPYSSSTKSGIKSNSSSSPLIHSIEKNPPPPISLSSQSHPKSNLDNKDELMIPGSFNEGNSHNHDNEEDENELNTIRSQLSRILPPPPTGPIKRFNYLSIIEEVLGKFYNTEKIASQNGRNDEPKQDIYTSSYGIEDIEYDNWIYLVTPFVCVLSRPVGIFLGFQKLMERLKTFPSIPSRLASFLTLFRLALPELHSYCEDEQVPYVQVAMSWMTTLLAKELWLSDILRLWDAYLAADDMFALHCYVCVAILSTCKETLEELDGSEAKLMLLDLPPLDVDRLLQDASNLRVSFPLPRPVEDTE